MQTILHYLPFVAALLGPLGSLLEATGNPKLVALGQKLESLSLDLPKLFGKVSK
jgi:hypothetical protein